MKKDMRSIIYILFFLIALHISPATYVNSSFLAQFVGDANVGYLFAIGSIVALITLFYIKVVLKKLGNYKTFMSALLLDFISLIVLSLSLGGGVDAKLIPVFIITFITAIVAQVILMFNMDIFLEHYSKDSDTGGIRGLFLTAFNAAFILGPFIAGLLITDTSEAGKVYAFNALVLISIAIIARKYLKGFEDSEYKRSDKVKSLIHVWNNRDLSKVCISDFILRIFYSWMVIYIPIYLHSIGFELGDVALIMSFALLPFIFLQAPLGKLADRYFGEKEILTLGFMITGLSTILITFFDTHSFWFWAILLFATRVGASMIEVMNEIYLFKKINDSNVNILSIYRSLRPLAYIVGPAVASLLLLVLDIQNLFFILGLVVLSGMVISTRLRDTL